MAKNKIERVPGAIEKAWMISTQGVLSNNTKDSTKIYDATVTAVFTSGCGGDTLSLEAGGVRIAVWFDDVERLIAVARKARHGVLH